MFEVQKMLFLYVETPLHAGAGRGLGAVDLPIQRERATGYPMLQASSLKGILRAAYREAKGFADDSPEVATLFGKAGEAGESFAGALAPGDARLLLFPVRSLAGVFAYVTSEHALETFFRSAGLTALDVKGWTIPKLDPVLDVDKAWVSQDSLLKVGDVVVFEEFSFTAKTTPPQTPDLVAQLGAKIAQAALPAQGYQYWVDNLPRRLCILPENAFRDFVLHATEIQTHIKLDPATKTVVGRALWTVESLPVDTLLYAPLMAAKPRSGGSQSAVDALTAITNLGLTHLQMGGDETTGQGWVTVTIVP